MVANNNNYPNTLDKVKITAVMNFTNINYEEAIELLERFKWCVVDAIRFYKENLSKASTKPINSLLKPVPVSEITKPQTTIPPGEYQAESKPDLKEFAHKSKLLDKFIESTGESGDVAEEYLEAEEWILLDALFSYHDDQTAFKKANKL